MKIATYNLKFLFDAGVRLYSGKEHTFTAEFVEKRFDHFASQFDLIDADILFLQELGDESALQQVLAKTKHAYQYFIAESDRYGVGNAVVYKESIQCKCFSVKNNTSLPTFSSEDEDVIGKRLWSRRDYVKLETVYDGKPLILFGIHIKANFLMYEEGSSFHSHPESVTQIESADAIIRSEMFRLSQGKKLREEIDAVFETDKDAQIIILGDYNTVSSRDKLFELIIGHIKNQYDSLIPVIEASDIDHICVSQSIEDAIVEKKIYDNAIGEDDVDGIESDHAPISIELQ